MEVSEPVTPNVDWTLISGLTELEPAALIVWRDAYFDFDRAGAGTEPRDDYLVRTVGFVLGLSERFVTIGSEALPDDDGYRAVTHVPRECVQSIALMTVAVAGGPQVGGPAGFGSSIDPVES